MRQNLLFAVLAICAGYFPASAAERPGEKGSVHFRPAANEETIPERYRLADHTFEWEMTPKYDLPASGFSVARLRFPSPVETDCPENNTVHAEYFRPNGVGPFPAVVVLDITAGDMKVPRMEAGYLARHGVAALFVKMAYYNERRPPGCERRLLSSDFPHTLAAIRQTVLDLRRAAAWLEARPEVDARRIGIMGTSLGSFIGTLTAEMEPRYRRVGVLLGGAALVAAFYDDPRAASLRKAWEAIGGSRESLVRAIAPVDPITCAANIRDRKVLIMAGRNDDVVPPKAAEALWRATGEQKLLWFDCDHLGAVFYVAPALEALVDHFGAE
jgi:dienelactone hydrolase